MNANKSDSSLELEGEVITNTSTLINLYQGRARRVHFYTDKKNLPRELHR